MGTGQKRGKLTRTITVMTNDRNSQTVSLECEAEILSALKCDPETVNFGQIKRSDAKIEKLVKITRGNGGPLNLKVGAINNPQITAELREIEPGERYELQVVAQPPWPNGMLRASVPVETGLEQAPSENISVFGNVAARAQVNPQRFTIRPDPENGLKLVARLNWDDNQPGKITEATVNDPALKVQVEDQDNQQVVVLDVPAGYNPPRGKGTQVTVKTDDPAVPALQIPVFAITTPTSEPAAATTGPAGGPAMQRANPAMLRARAIEPSPAPPTPASAPAGGAQPK